MTPKINRKLTEMRKLMEKAAWGPEIPSTAKTPFQDAKGGVGEADNEINIQDALNFYLQNIANAMIDEFGIDEPHAHQHIESCADEMSQDGLLPPFPECGCADSDVILWLGKAKSLGFEGYCIKATRDSLADEEMGFSHDHDEDSGEFDTDDMDLDLDSDSDMDSM